MINFACFYLTVGVVVALTIDLDLLVLEFFQWVRFEKRRKKLLKESRVEDGDADNFMLLSLVLLVVLAWPVFLWGEG